jgi:hypothetical protein
MAEVQDPLAALRDIHLPAPPDLWPPAPGWWVLGVLVIALCVYGAYLGRKLWRRNAYRRQGLKELDSLFARSESSTTELLADLNDLLKRVALSCSSRDDVAQLTGESWVAYLDSKIPGHEFTMGAGQVLIDGPYSETSHDINRSELQRVARLWIQTHRMAA